MPLYEYECVACGRRFEALQKFSDEPLRVCARCGGSVNRLISSSAIQFKGTGWYVTDYARKAAASESKSDGADKKEAGKEGAPPPSAKSAKSESAKESSNTSPGTPATD